MSDTEDARITGAGEPVSTVMPLSFRKRPVVIEAMQTDGTYATAKAIEAWAGPHLILSRFNPTFGTCAELVVYTLEGAMRADVGDWIIKGVHGEFYPCKPDIFAASYEPSDARSEP